MKRLKSIAFIIRKELKSYFDNPTAYVVMIVFLFLWEFLFFRSVFLVGEASLRILFDYLPWLFIILVPAVTMGSLSQERDAGTLEFLFAHPLRRLDFILGKFAAGLIFLSLTLLFIFPVAYGLQTGGRLDWGVVLGQYLGSVFLAATFVSLGIFVSGLFKSQISSLLTAAALSFFLVIVGTDFVGATLPVKLTPLLDRLSVLSHFRSTARGVIDVRDLWYYLSLTAIFLSLSYLKLLRDKYGRRGDVYGPYRLGVALFIGIAVLTDILGSRIPGRVDLTQNHRYTLSPATREILGSLNDVVNVTLYASSQLPVPLQPVLRDAKDMLRDYQTLAHGNLLVKVKDPAADPAAADEARAAGIKEVQFNVVGRSEFRLKKGYLGLAVAYGGKNEAIPFLKDTGDLEYQLTSFINKLTSTKKEKVVFTAGHGEKSIYSDYTLWKSELEKQFEVGRFETPSAEENGGGEESLSLPPDTKVLVVAGPTKEIDKETRRLITDYIDDGGAALFLLDPVPVNNQTLSAAVNKNSFADFLKTYGLSVENDLVYDLRANETVSAGDSSFRVLLPYPLWVRALAPQGGSSLGAGALVLPWPSSISLDENKLKENGYRAEKFYTTSPFAGKETEPFFLKVDYKFPSEDLGEVPLIVGLQSDQSSQKPKGRMLVVGDSDFISDKFAQNRPENTAFGVGAVSWLAQTASLAAIKTKRQPSRGLMFKGPTQVALVKYGNLGLTVVIPLGIALVNYWRRKRLRGRQYRPFGK
jgi:ABC-type uncharacterized transport system involved in gliding motility auxiliary subunit/ABC-type transport system involved in multi-copper enzyme maturation permease subunit